VPPGIESSAAAESGNGLRRFARHLSLPGFGSEAQERLRLSRVLCIGAGGLGSPALLYLAAGGVGQIVIVDDDRVELSNLQRQVLFSTGDLGQPKAEAAAMKLRALYPEIRVEPHVTRFMAANAMRLAQGAQVIVDGSDNFSTRYVSNDTAVLLGIPNVYGSIYRYEGQASVFAPSLDFPCYRCLFPAPPAPGKVPTCADDGVLGVLPGLIGTIQATETIKLITGIGTSLGGRLLHLDALTMRFRELALRRDPNCPACGEQRVIFSPQDPVFQCTLKPTAAAVTAEELAALLDHPEQALCILDVREQWEQQLSPWEKATMAIPTGELSRRWHEVPNECPRIIVVCSIGERSAGAAEFLISRGLSGVQHLHRGLRDFPGFTG
jgi:adenylyltransferase/sulfurtransferase